MCVSRHAVHIFYFIEIQSIVVLKKQVFYLYAKAVGVMKNYSTNNSYI